MGSRWRTLYLWVFLTSGEPLAGDRSPAAQMADFLVQSVRMVLRRFLLAIQKYTHLYTFQSLIRAICCKKSGIAIH
ncbi:hypothetical protein H4V99_002941 [Cryobacterium sp. CG_9.6]|nr:hypothetical protein [Cryobacterium sp. CG_9.6]